MYELTIKFETLEEISEYLLSRQVPCVVDKQEAIALPGVAEAIAPSSVTEVNALPETDANGMLWDERIHTSTKTQTKDEVWKRKRGVDDETFNAVTAELQGGGLNHTQLLNSIIDKYANGDVSLFAVVDVCNVLGIDSLQDASGNPEMIEKISEALNV